MNYVHTYWVPKKEVKSKASGDTRDEDSAWHDSLEKHHERSTDLARYIRIRYRIGLYSSPTAASRMWVASSFLLTLKRYPRRDYVGGWHLRTSLCFLLITERRPTPEQISDGERYFGTHQDEVLGIGGGDVAALLMSPGRVLA